MFQFVLIAALLPVVLLIAYIYRKDKYMPEPTGQLAKAFLFGILSCPLSFCLSIPFGYMGLYPVEVANLLDGVRLAFFGAAIPEELAKLLVLWLFLRKNRYFDEKMDGIVYSVCVSLGFAALENVMYLFDNYDNWLSVGVSRALFSVPGHFGFGVLMGYYYSLVAFYPHVSVWHRVMVVAAPVLAHGIFNSILFAFALVPSYMILLMVIVFLVFCCMLWKLGSRKIKEHLARDEEDFMNRFNPPHL